MYNHPAMYIAIVRMRFTLAILLALFIGRLPALGLPRAGAPYAAPARGQSALQAKAGKVKLSITALRKGRPVTNLTKTDLELWLGKKHERISSLAFNPPMRLVMGVLMDSSGSQHADWPVPEIAIAPAFLRSVLLPGDLTFLAHFSYKEFLDAAPTRNLAKLGHGIRTMESLSPRGGTALWDAIAQSSDLLKRYPGSRHILVVVTDGQDTASKITSEQAERIARGSDTEVYFIAAVGATGPNSGLSPIASVKLGQGWASMSMFARATGGSVFPTAGKLGAMTAFKDVAWTIRSQYALTFQPTAPAGWRTRIRIKCLRKGVKIIAPEYY